jgi:nucleoside-diphosphate-sugar epimerase
MNSPRETVVITGSSGLIGSTVARRLAGRYAVVGFDVEGPESPIPGVEFVEVNLTSEESVRDGLRRVRERHGERIASVIHLAAYYDFAGRPSPKYDEITVRGTERLLRGLRGFRVEQFLFSSTTLVYAPTEPGRPIDEEAPLEPKWDYPQSKVATEELIRVQHGDIPVVLLRIAGVYDDRGHSPPIANHIQRIYERWLSGQVYPGDPARGQAFIHLDDLVEAIARLVERRAQLPPELTLHVGEPETLSYDTLQRELGRLIHGEEREPRQVPKAVAKAGAWVQDAAPFAEEPFIKPWMIDLADDHLELDISRARELLDWEPRRSLRGTLPRIVDALRADPLGWYRENKLNPPDRLEEAASDGGHGAEAPVGPDLVRGALAGLLATAPMTLAMKAMHRELPWWERHPLPPRRISETVAETVGLRARRREPEATMLTGLSHFAYGAAAGAAYAPLARALPGPPALKGTAYGLAVWAVSYQGWLPALEILPPATEQPARRTALMIAAHVVWGSALGIAFDYLQRRGR